MDLEAEIRALQLDSAEGNNGIVISEDHHSDGVEKLDRAEEDLKDNVQESVPVPVEQQAIEDHDQEMLLPVHNPAKVKEKAAQEKPAKDEAEEEAEANKKRHLNVVFIGHVDAGKSTIGGQMLFLSGQVDDRQIQKYEKEAKDKSRESCVNWSKERYDEIEQKMVPFLKSSGYNTKKDVIFLPISGIMGINMDKRMDQNVCPWYSGSSFFEVLNSVEVPPRDPNGPFRMPIIDKFKDMGTVVMGKVESGSIKEGDSLVIMPNKEHVKVVAIYCDEDKVKRAGRGENLRVRITGIEDEDILSGFVLSSTVKRVPVVTEFEAQLQILELLDKDIFTAGYKAVLHIHAVVEECEVIELISQIDMKTKEPMKTKKFVKNGAVVVCRKHVTNSIGVEKFSDFPQLGRFTLRTEGKTVAVRKVTELSAASSSA